MIGLDTNVLVRYLAQDDARQAARATKLLEAELTASSPGFVSTVVLAELCGVLQRLYAATPIEVTLTVADLLALPQLRFERREAIQAALQQAGFAKAGFVDRLIAELAAAQGCVRTLTFDRKAVRDAGMSLLV